MKWIWRAGLMGIMSVFFFLALYYSGLAGEQAGTVNVFLNGQTLDKKAAEEICAQEAEQDTPLPVCFWKEQKEVEFTCKETGKTSLGTTIVTVGNSELVAAGTSPLAWQEQGCFLDIGLAEELFGTSQALGQNVWCEGTAYTVCGTFEGMEKSMIRQMTKEDGAILNALCLGSGESPAGKTDGEQFLLRYGLTGEIIEFSFVNMLVRDLILLLPIFVMVLMAGRLFGGKLAALVALAAVVLWVMFAGFSIPADMIPTKWSDFSFWADWWKEQKQNILYILGTAQGEAQLSMLWNLVRAFACGLCAAFAGSLLFL